MKRKENKAARLSFIMAATLMLGAASCKKDSSNGEAPLGEGSFRAYTESSGGKTQLVPGSDPNTYDIRWTAGDEIKIFSEGGYSAEYRTQTGGNGSATFDAVSTAGFSEDGAHLAVYPYSEGVTCSSEGFASKTVEHLELPKTQHYRENSFDNGAYPMFAYAGDDEFNLQFKNLCGVLCITLYDLPSKVTEISVKAGKPGERLWGKCSVRLDASTNIPKFVTNDDGIVWDNDGEDGSTVVLDCGEGVECNSGSYETGTKFYIVLPVGTLSQGFNVTVTCENGYTKTVVSTKDNSIVRREVKKMEAKLFYAVDMGTGVLWAPCNLGANSPEGYGDYYVWAATELIYNNIEYHSTSSGGIAGDITINTPKYNNIGFNFDTQNCPFCISGGNDNPTFSKYIGTDNNELLKEDDAAFVAYGGAWRMPSHEDFEKLKTTCTLTFTWVNSVLCLKCTSNDNKSIFFPAAGRCSGIICEYPNDIGYYLSRSLYSDDVKNAHSLRFDRTNGVYASNYHSRCTGFSVRPVLAPSVL